MYSSTKRVYRKRKGRVALRIAIAFLILGGIIVFALSRRKKAEPPPVQAVVETTPTPAPKNDYVAEPEPTLRPIADNGARIASEHKTSYTIDIVLDALKNTLSCTQEVEVVNSSEKPIHTVAFRLFPNALGKAAIADTEEKFPNGYKPVSFSLEGSLVDAIAVEGELNTDETVLSIPLPLELAAGEKTRIVLSYTQVLPRSVYDYGFNARGFNAAWFYPVLAPFEEDEWVIEDMSPIGMPYSFETSDYTATIRVPVDYTVSCTGQIEKTISTEQQTVYYIRASSMRDFAFQANNRTKEQTAQAQGVTITARAGTIEKSVLLTTLSQSILDAYVGFYGAFPYKSLSIAQASLWTKTAEHASLVLVDAACVQGNTSVLEHALARAIAKEWFGCALSSDSNEQWVNNALAEYAATAYFAQKYGAEKGNAAYLENVARFLPSELPLLKPQMRPASEEESKTLSLTGTAMLHELAQQVSTEEFNAAMTRYAQQYKHGRGSLRAIVDEFTAADTDLTSFFSRWIDFSAD